MHYRRRVPAAHFDDAQVILPAACGGVAPTMLRASAELDANLQVSAKTETRLVTRTVPPVCTTKIDLAAGFVAELFAYVSAGAVGAGEIRRQFKCFVQIGEGSL